MSLGATANRHSTARTHRDRFGSSAVVFGPSSCLLVKSTALLWIVAARPSPASHQTSAETFAWSTVPRILHIGRLQSSLAASTKLTCGIYQAHTRHSMGYDRELALLLEDSDPRRLGPRIVSWF